MGVGGVLYKYRLMSQDLTMLGTPSQREDIASSTSKQGVCVVADFIAEVKEGQLAVLCDDAPMTGRRAERGCVGEGGKCYGNESYIAHMYMEIHTTTFI